MTLIKRDRAKGDGKGENADDKGKPIGTGEAGSSTDVPRDRQPSVGDPATPEQITRSARDNWSAKKLRMAKHSEYDIPRIFRNNQGVYYLMLDKFLEDLKIRPNEYSPI